MADFNDILNMMNELYKAKPPKKVPQQTAQATPTGMPPMPPIPQEGLGGQPIQGYMSQAGGFEPSIQPPPIPQQQTPLGGPDINAPYRTSNALATLAQAIAPNSMGGRLGEGVLGMNQQEIKNQEVSSAIAQRGEAMRSMAEYRKALAQQQAEKFRQQQETEQMIQGLQTIPPVEMTRYKQGIGAVTGAYGKQLPPPITTMGQGLTPEYPEQYKQGLEAYKGAVPPPQSPLEKYYPNPIERTAVIQELRKGTGLSSLLKPSSETMTIPTEYGPVKMSQEKVGEAVLRRTEKSRSEEQLITQDLRDKLGREPTAGEVLKAQEERKSIIEQGKIEAKTKGINIPSLINMVETGMDSLEGVKNAFGVPVQALVQSQLAEKNPKFSFIKSDANKRYLTTPQNLRVQALVEASYPRVQSLLQKADALGNLAYPRSLNMGLNALRKEFGSKAIADFESMRNAILSEVNTALTGSSTGSDFRIQLELEQLKTSATPAQLKVSINNLLDALDARGEASSTAPYPMEEVRGEVQFANSRQRREFWQNKIANERAGEIQPMPQGGGTPTPQTWKAGQPVPQGYKEQYNPKTGQRRIVPR